MTTTCSSRGLWRYIKRIMEYKDMTDNELVSLAQQGDEAALETALLRYKPLVHKKSQPYYLAGGDDDDIVQEGLIGLYKAIMEFDKDKFPLFKVFAGVCIERRIISAVKKASRIKHSPLNSYISLSSSAEEDGVNAEDIQGAVSDPESILIERERAEVLEMMITGALSDMELRVLLAHLNGKSYKETAEELGRDVKAVDNAMQRIKKKLESLI